MESFTIYWRRVRRRPTAASIIWSGFWIDSRTAREMNAKLQSIEGDADKLELDRLRDLFQGNYDPKQVIFLHDLYGLLEKVIDRCRDAGNIILQVALKYS